MAFRLQLTLILCFSFLSVTVRAQLPLYDLPEPFANPVTVSGSLALTNAGRIVVANQYTDTLTIIGLDRALEAEIEIGADPRSVAISSDNTRALATSYGDSILSEIDLNSGAIAASHDIGAGGYHVLADAAFAYVSLPDEAAIAIVERATGSVRRIPTPPAPAALALWGDFLYVTHFWSGELSLIYLPAAEVVRTIRPHPNATLSPSIEIDPFNGRAFLAGSLRTAGTLDNRFIPVVHIIDLETMLVEDTLNLVLADRNVSQPFAAAQPQNRSRLYVAHAGSNSVTVLNLDTGVADNHFDVGANPRAIRFNSTSTQVITHDAVDATVSVIGTAFFDVLDAIPTSATILPADVQRGARLFHSAVDERMSSNGLINCASCHINIAAAVTTPLVDDITAAPEAITGDWLNTHISEMQGGSGLDVESIDMAALLAFLRR